MSSYSRRILVIAAALMSFHGCGGTGSIAKDAAASSDEYVVLDLDSGTIAGAGSIRDARTDTSFRSSKILFRRIPSGTTRIGTEGNLSTSQEQVLTTVSHDTYLIGVFEVTQAQWRRLAGTEPWTASIYATAFGSAGASSGIGNDKPAYGMSFNQAQEAAATWSRDGWTVDVPTVTEWEVACRAGTSNKLFPWGASSTAQNNQAVYRETNAATIVPRDVGLGRVPNAFGVYDMIGNVWEYAVPSSTSEVNLRGGAFDQPLLVCRISHQVAVPRDLGLPTAGVRLVLRRSNR